ncbi:creatininase family protein [candidate division KSB1 bacterium]|nr:creatininase family protein [candidate division KSB1 bacterium]
MILSEHPLILLLFMAALFVLNVIAQESASLTTRYEELTAPDFIQAVQKAGGVCIIPLGILEKHGAHLPLGTDLIDCRETVFRAAKKEYCVVFPQFYFGQIYEAKHQPGTIAYSPDLVWKILQETCEELARNGLKKIILVNGHGGNNYLLPYFCQAQLASQKDYAVILFRPEDDPEVMKKVEKLRQTTTGGHACELETSMMLSHRPDLVHLERANQQSGADQDRIKNLPHGYAGIWWYARYPNHYAGDGSKANPEIGNLLINSEAEQLAALIKAVKQNTSVLELQQQFFDSARKPLETKQ